MFMYVCVCTYEVFVVCECMCHSKYVRTSGSDRVPKTEMREKFSLTACSPTHYCTQLVKITACQ